MRNGDVTRGLLRERACWRLGSKNEGKLVEGMTISLTSATTSGLSSLDYVI